MIRHLPIALAVVASLLRSAPAAEDPGRLKALFLGDRGHHAPADRAAQLIPVLVNRGIDVTYTEDVNALDPKALAGYDALIVYANIDNISPEQERALVGFVEGGGGFVPIHCASYCFRNSEAYVALVGAQFQRHGTGEFDTKVVAPDHPIMQGYEPFHTWDETYVHTKPNPDRLVLQVRPDPAGDEPWTWVREQGKGRVFYTAYGHDERTFGHPGFHDLIERGLRWAAHKGEVFDSRPRVSAGLKPLEYVAATDKIPNYLPGQKWGTQGEPLNEMQTPLDPAESVKHMAVPAGFEVRLFAAEPEVLKPICMAWDHRGRLWIVESTDYPNNKLDRDETGHDRIKIVEDTDGDGRADKYTIFAEGLNIPTSLTFARGGVVVHQAPETLFLKDTDGDDKADSREVLLSGWGTRDTHAGPSNLRYGLDNWIWGIVGYSAFQGTVGGERLDFRQGLYRFQPDGSTLEFLRSTNNNSWGLGFSEEGIVFGSTANGCPSVYMPIPNRYYESVRGWSARVLNIIADTNRFFPATPRVRQVDWHGGFTAGAGHALYTARAYPENYWNKVAFVAEPTGHLIATFSLQPKGSDFASHNAWNLVASDDEWTSPIAAEVGPDGNVWFIDWYSYIVQHNPTPQGFRTGRGQAYETTLRDKVHGRIYRLVYKADKPSTITALDPDDPKALVAALKDDNQFWRLHAQRLLVERGKADVVGDLVALVQDRSADPLGLNVGAIHALWTLHGLGALKDADADATRAAVAALKHPSAGVRRNAVQVVPRAESSAKAILAADLLADADPQVRLATLLALSEMPPSDAIAGAIVSGFPRVGEDPWLNDAAIVVAAANDRAFLKAVTQLAEARAGKSGPSDRLHAAVQRVAEHYARGGPADSVGELIVALSGASPDMAEAVLAGLDRGWPANRPARLDDDAEAALGKLLGHLSLTGKGRLAALSRKWGTDALDRYTAEVADSLRATLADASKPEAERIDAARQLVEFRKADAPTAQFLLAQITPRTAPALASGLLDALARTDAPGVGAELAAALPSLTPGIRPAAVRALLGRADWTDALLKGMESGQVRLSELTLDQRQSLLSHPNRAIARRAQRLLDRGGGLPDPDRQKVIDELAPIALRGGDPAKGKAVFTEQCAKCHTHSGEGGKVGPDLTGMAAHPRDELLVHVLDPSRSVEGNYLQYTVATADGRVLNGLLASESKTAVELLDAEGKAHALPRDEIDELVASKKSVMPDGFEKQIPPASLADLLAFLTRRGKYLPLDLRKVATAVSTRGMFYNLDADAERLIFPDWSPKTVADVPFTLVDPQDGRVPNVILLHSPNGTIPPQMPKSVSLPVHAPAKAIHLLGGVAGWAFPASQRGSTSLIVRLHYADGATEDHALKNGEHVADYIRVVDVPGSTLAFKLRDQQVRYLALTPGRTDEIASIEFLKGPDRTAPIIMAVTVEVGE